jgi:hypothetical protein
MGYTIHIYEGTNNNKYHWHGTIRDIVPVQRTVPRATSAAMQKRFGHC